ncbi:hypothetical protein WJX73_003576 [Symbiochloris irregularis]|uniref:Purine permease n=1 Tax=Symbiochloris irregularis TaxID=706552 RepID=A0AAW1PMZ1_9CHLO
MADTLNAQQWQVAQPDLRAVGLVALAGTLDILIGSYDYSYLFRLRWPYGKAAQNAQRLPQFFGVNEPLPLLLAVILGFQHAAAMVGGIIAGTLTVTVLNPDQAITEYLVGVSLVASGIGTITHVIRFKLFSLRGKTFYYGTGVVSVMGVTTTEVVIGLQVIANDVARGTSWNDAFGKFLGTNLICVWITFCVSWLPTRILRKLFPSWIAGLTVFLVGVNLLGIGMKNWGGGYNCAEGYEELCSGNGTVQLPYGSISYLGLGSVCFLVLLAIEIFGSPFLRNAEIILALLIGYAVAAFVRHDGDKYTNGQAIRSAPAGIFFWLHTFKLGIYPGAILPFLIGYLADAATAIGDLTATEEASFLETHGTPHDERVQGCLLADSINSFLATLATSLPINIFAQNNGIISFTLCASRIAGVCAGLWLILFGVLGNVGAFFTYVPNCVLGGIETFLFGTIAVAGIKVLVEEHLIDRRTRFIVAIAGGVGIGVTIVPNFATAHLWLISDNASAGIRALHDSIILILSTGYVLGWLTAMLLNLIVPAEVDPYEALRQARLRGELPLTALPGMHTAQGEQPTVTPGLSERPSLSEKPGLEAGDPADAEQDAHLRKMIEIEG